MKDPRNLVIGGLLGVAAFLAGHALRGETATGQGYPGGTADSNGRMIAVTGTIGSGVSVLWLIDTAEPHLAIYQCKGGKTVELVAARKIEWDLKIEEFRDESLYSPEDLRKMFYRNSAKGVPGVGTPETEGVGPEGRSSEEEDQEGTSVEKR